MHAHVSLYPSTDTPLLPRLHPHSVVMVVAMLMPTVPSEGLVPPCWDPLGLRCVLNASLFSLSFSPILLLSSLSLFHANFDFCFSLMSTFPFLFFLSFTLSYSDVLLLVVSPFMSFLLPVLLPVSHVFVMSGLNRCLWHLVQCWKEMSRGLTFAPWGHVLMRCGEDRKQEDRPAQKTACQHVQCHTANKIQTLSQKEKNG